MAEYIKPENDRYIKLSQALEVLDSCACWWAHDQRELIPAADVRPVRRGKWVGYPECLKYPNAYSDDHIVCSAAESASLWMERLVSVPSLASNALAILLMDVTMIAPCFLCAKPTDDSAIWAR